MKKVLLTLLVFLVIPMFGITYVHVDGSDYAEIVIPTGLTTITANTANPGNPLVFRVYVDENLNGEFDSSDPIVTLMGCIDGVPPFGDRDSLGILGDEDGSGWYGNVNSQVSFQVDLNDVDIENISSEITMFVIAEDLDGSTAQATIVLSIGTIPVGDPPYFVGTIIDSETGDGIEGIIISLTDEEDEEYYTAFTDEDGHYSISVPGPGDYYLDGFVDMTGIYPSMMTGSEDPFVMPMGVDSIVIDTTLTAFDARLNGRVVFDEDGSGVPGVMVFAYSVMSEEFSMATTDDDGYYSLGQNIGTGAMAYVSIEMENPRYVPDTSYYIVMVTAETIDVEDFRLIELSTYVEGHVYLPDSVTPVPGMVVNASSIEDYFYATTNEDGAYRVYVKPDGNYTITMEDSGIPTLPNYYEERIDSVPVSDLNFYIDDTDGLPYVSGEVVNPDETPIENAYVIITPEEDILDWRFAMTDADGHFEFTELIPGSWMLGAYKNGYRDPSPEIDYYPYLFTGAYVDDARFILYTEGIEDKITVADRMELLGAYPNPFNPATKISIKSKEERLTLEIYDEYGRKIKEIQNILSNSGIHNFEVDGSDLPSGTYLYKVKNNEEAVSGKIILIK